MTARNHRARQRALLAILAVNAGHTVSVDRLVDHLLCDARLVDPANAERSIR